MLNSHLRRSPLVLTALALTTACADDLTSASTDETSTTGHADTGTDDSPDSADTSDTADAGEDDTEVGEDETDTGEDETDTGDEEYCGDEVIDRGEQCDGDNVGAMSCEREGYDGGTLGCTAECTFDLSECCNDACPEVDQTQCNGDTIEICSVGDNGCLVWTAETDCAGMNEYCDASRGPAVCVPVCVDQCDADGDMQCNGDVIETCSIRDEGCLGWVAGEDCSAGNQYCDASGDAPVCTCDDQCVTEGELQCAMGDDAVEICSEAANGCLEWAVETTCAEEQVCELVGDEPVCYEPLTYCIPSYSTGCTSNDDIDDFTIVDADQNLVLEHLDTGCSPGAYADYTEDPSLLISLAPLSSYSFTITHNFSSQRVKIWIDFDLDGQFDDTELLFESPSTANPTNGQFFVPMAAPMTTRMRVMDRWSTTPTNACDPGGAFGETHDYAVEILDTGVTCDNFEANVTNVSPADGATTTSLTPTLEVSFDHPVSTEVGVVSVTGDLGTDLSYDLSLNPAAVTFSNNNQTMTITLAGALPAGENITVDWVGLEDAYCGNPVPVAPWTFDVLTPPCSPGTDGMVGTSTSSITTDLPNFSEYYLAVDEDPNGWIYMGNTSALHRVSKTDGSSEDITAAVGLTGSNLGYDMLVLGSEIYTLEMKMTGTTGHVWRLSTDGGATWDLQDYAELPAEPQDWLRSIYGYNGEIFVATDKWTSAPTEVFSMPSGGEPLVAAALGVEFAETRCVGLAVDDAHYYMACRTTSDDEVVRVDRATGEVTVIATGWPLDSSANGMHAHDADNDGVADYLYLKSGHKNVVFVCDPAGDQPYSDLLVSYGAPSSTSYGLGFDRAANRLYAYDDGPREIIVIE
ncbi:MAG: GEVED domain-containing protein [Enhygromyxa sp.]